MFYPILIGSPIDVHCQWIISFQMPSLWGDEVIFPSSDITTRNDWHVGSFRTQAYFSLSSSTNAIQKYVVRSVACFDIGISFKDFELI